MIRMANVLSQVRRTGPSESGMSARGRNWHAFAVIWMWSTRSHFHRMEGSLRQVPRIARCVFGILPVIRSTSGFTTMNGILLIWPSQPWEDASSQLRKMEHFAGGIRPGCNARYGMTAPKCVRFSSLTTAGGLWQPITASFVCMILSTRQR